MAYTPFANDKPLLSDSGAAVVSDTRNNLMALRDALVMGTLVGWSMTASPSGAIQPTTLTYSQGTERIRLTVTWGTTAGASGNPTQVVYEYSSNSGGVWDAMGTVALGYGTAGGLTTVNWS